MEILRHRLLLWCLALAPFLALAGTAESASSFRRPPTIIIVITGDPKPVVSHQ